MCPLKAFVESQAWSQTDVDWTDCLEKKQKGHA
jgi:hypothetical protein